MQQADVGIAFWVRREIGGSSSARVRATLQDERVVILSANCLECTFRSRRASSVAEAP